MVAVLTVVANHLWDWPRGGFVGVDVFFVISGYLITGNLLRDAERSGNVSFRKFYWRRVRRIVPAATVVLILTYVAALLVYLPFRANQVGIDALFAFFFMVNWHLASQNTDYFEAAAATVSPVQHYWSLSIEEQFYFVWPALIFLIGLVVAGLAWNHARRMWLAAGVMSVVVVASLGWALHETATSPTWAYFSTFSRVWELGVGALLATVVGQLARIPQSAKPFLSWAGLLLIGVSVLLINDGTVGFPAPWALLPVAGAALVISAGVDGEPNYQGFLQNPVSTYIGDISYSLYLVHWPIIVILGSLMDGGVYFSLCVLTTAFGLAILSYHFVESPLRYGTKERLRDLQSTQYAAVAASALLVAALYVYVSPPQTLVQATPPSLAAATPDGSGAAGIETQVALGPSATGLRGEIDAALAATDWPALDPSMASVIDAPSPVTEPLVRSCYNAGTVADPQGCVWGSPTAPIRAILVGDSIAVGYAAPLAKIALNSGDQIQVQSFALASCPFVNDNLSDEEPLSTECARRKQEAVDAINTTQPNVVIVSNIYSENARVAGSTNNMGSDDWSRSLGEIVHTFRASTGKVVFLAPPAGDLDIKDCFSRRSSTPAECVGAVTNTWNAFALAERDLAKDIGGVWVDSWPWFCSRDGLCPSFVGTIPAKWDSGHMSGPYAAKLEPVIAESLREAGVF